ncbi:hypothetical protein Zmor_015857 [Zophobas morio]|uniref:Adenylate kinase isoenzyme 1 n=2 Tax=Zophobas morio TaxID=2755281 RepID=A0AA38IKX4_9CUCU|nr:hypothetical protein Zmor_015857 [Zophobas morio]
MVDPHKLEKPNIDVPVIWVIGGPGSGKGTQCEQIAIKYGLEHISVGKLLRDEVENGSCKGAKLKHIMDRGELVPNEVVIDMLKTEMLNRLCNAKGFLIDGYPRQKEQGILFQEKIAAPTTVLYLELSNNTMLERLRKRALSSTRSDDNEETMQRRITTFNQENNQILAQFAYKVKKIDAERHIEAIFKEISDFLDTEPC